MIVADACKQANMQNKSLLPIVKRTSNVTTKLRTRGPSGVKGPNCPYCGYKSWPSLEFALKRHMARKHLEIPNCKKNLWGLFACNIFVMGPYVCQPCMFHSYFKLSVLEHRRRGHVWVPGGKRWKAKFQLDCCGKHNLAQRQSTVPIRSLLVYLGAFYNCRGKVKNTRTKKRKSVAETRPYASLMETLKRRIGEQCQELTLSPGPQTSCTGRSNVKYW